MSLTDQDRIEMAADNCEVLRARLANYEDAEGRPVSSAAEFALAIADYREQLPAGFLNRLAALKAQPSGVVLPEPEIASEINRLIGLWDAKVAWSGQCMEELLDHAAKAATLIARLNSSPVSAGVVDERAAFETWYLGHFYMGDKQCGLEWLSTEPCGGYRHQHPAEQWIVWQARAALSAPSYAQDAGEVVAYWSDFSMVSVRFGDRVGTYVESCAPSHGEQVRHMVLAGWKLVPVEPTPEMISAAEEAHMPFGDMDIALRCALFAAPSAGSQGGDV